EQHPPAGLGSWATLRPDRLRHRPAGRGHPDAETHWRHLCLHGPGAAARPAVPTIRPVGSRCRCLSAADRPNAVPRPNAWRTVPPDPLCADAAAEPGEHRHDRSAAGSCRPAAPRQVVAGTLALGGRAAAPAGPPRAARTGAYTTARPAPGGPWRLAGAQAGARHSDAAGAADLRGPALFLALGAGRGCLAPGRVHAFLPGPTAGPLVANAPGAGHVDGLRLAGWLQRLSLLHTGVGLQPGPPGAVVPVVR